MILKLQSYELLNISGAGRCACFPRRGQNGYYIYGRVNSKDVCGNICSQNDGNTGWYRLDPDCNPAHQHRCYAECQTNLRLAAVSAVDENGWMEACYDDCLHKSFCASYPLW